MDKKNVFDENLVQICKNGQSISVDPAVLDAHKRLGWVEVLAPQVTYSLEEVKKMVDDAVKVALAGGKGAEPEQKPDEKPAGGKGAEPEQKPDEKPAGGKAGK